MIIYKLDRKHHFYTQYKSHLLGWKLQPLRNLWKQLYKNINIFIFTGCQTFIPWQLSEKALQIIESMVADNKKYILWFKYCLIPLVKSAYCDFSFTACAGNNEWNLQAPGGWSDVGNTQPHSFLFVCLFWPLSLVWGGNAYHFTCLLSDVICERGRAPCMSTSNKYIQGRNPWYREMVFSTPKHS